MVRNIQLKHSGKYVCMVHTEVDTVSAAADLIVRGRPPPASLAEQGPVTFPSASCRGGVEMSRRDTRVPLLSHNSCITEMALSQERNSFIFRHGKLECPKMIRV